MLNIIKAKLEAVLTSYSDLNCAKDEITNIVKVIREHLDNNKVEAAMHSTHRILDEYTTLYNDAVTKFHSIPQNNHYDRIYQMGQIVTISALLLSYLTRGLRKYNTDAPQSSSAGKSLRQLAEAREHYRNERVSWTTLISAEKAIIQAKTEALHFDVGCSGEVDIMGN